MKRIVPILLGLLLLSTSAKSQSALNCLQFDGSDDYVSCPLPSVFANIGTNEFTIELWASPTIGTFGRLFFAQLDVSNFAVISVNSSGEVAFYLEENGLNHSVQSSSTLNSLEWTHIAVTWSSTTQEAKIFINGTETPYATGIFISSTGVDNKMTIGSKTDGSQLFVGEFDELAIWNVAKSECEVRFEMKDKKTGSEPNLVSYYSFDHGTASGANPGANLLQDVTGNLNDGTLMNFALSGSASNWMLSLANITRFWGDESPLFLGQLGLVPTVDANQYQWINCNTGASIAGATNSTFDPPSEDPNYSGATGGLYAVISLQGNCVDTSECYAFNLNDVNELDLDAYVSIYPNPSQGVVSIESVLDIDLIEVLSITGEVIKTVRPTTTETLQIQLANENGFYLVVLHTTAGLLTKKVLVQNK
ncbi:MAG: hypothetical protein COA38_05820 [Fluviicola sp.]|nr:MAG: hypothetical protein COA38_05820 [Fluviicola sp.]